MKSSNKEPTTMPRKIAGKAENALKVINALKAIPDATRFIEKMRMFQGELERHIKTDLNLKQIQMLESKITGHQKTISDKIDTLTTNLTTLAKEDRELTNKKITQLKKFHEKFELWQLELKKLYQNALINKAIKEGNFLLFQNLDVSTKTSEELQTLIDKIDQKIIKDDRISIEEKKPWLEYIDNLDQIQKKLIDAEIESGVNNAGPESLFTPKSSPEQETVYTPIRGEQEKTNYAPIPEPIQSQDSSPLPPDEFAVDDINQRTEKN